MSSLRIATSEGVTLSREIAGAGSRFAAGLLDSLLIFGAYLALTLVLWLAGALEQSGFSAFVLGLVLGGAIFVVLAYHVAFHLMLHGQTPGKRALGIRVVSADGLPASPLQIVVRALILPIDVLVLVPVPLGLIVIAATEAHQRLGDWVAGTLVLRTREATAELEPWAGTRWSELPDRTLALMPGLAARLSPRDVDFLRRVILRSDLDTEARRALFVDVARHYRDRLGLPNFQDARVVLKEVYLFAREALETESRAERRS